jgi:hypothetical protein
MNYMMVLITLIGVKMISKEKAKNLVGSSIFYPDYPKNARQS